MPGLACFSLRETRYIFEKGKFSKLVVPIAEGQGWFAEALILDDVSSNIGIFLWLWMPLRNIILVF